MVGAWQNAWPMCSWQPLEDDNVNINLLHSYKLQFEVTNIDNQTWIWIHAYVVEVFRKTLILLNLKQITNGCTTNNLTNMIKISMKVFGGSFDHDLTTKVVYFDANSVGIFQGIEIRAAT